MAAPVEVAPPPVEFAQVDAAEAPVSEQVEAEIEAELQQEIEEPAPEPTEPEPEQAEPEPAEPTDTEPEQEPETRQAEPEQEEEQQEKPKVVAKKAVKEKIAKQIIKRMGSSGRYDSNNQIRTLVVMQVLGDSKSFFKSPESLQDKEGFFDNARVPDSIISDNNFAQYVLFGGSSAQHNNLVNLQWK